MFFFPGLGSAWTYRNLCDWILHVSFGYCQWLHPTDSRYATVWRPFVPWLQKTPCTEKPAVCLSHMVNVSRQHHSSCGHGQLTQGKPGVVSMASEAGRCSSSRENPA